MSENIGGPSAAYNTIIPSITDNADIQTAFRLYHYGSNTSTPSTIPADSLAGHLGFLELSKLSRDPNNIPNSANLNESPYTETGFYVQTTNSFAASGSNYPSPYSGLLKVVNDGGIVFQQYQVIGADESGSSTNTLNRTWWRFFYAGSWKSWRTFLVSDEFATIGDVRYYKKETVDANFYTKTFIDTQLSVVPFTYLTIAEANTRNYVQENLQTGSYSLQLSDLNKVVAVNNASTATVTVPANASVAFPIGSIVNVYAASNQTLNIAGASGVTVRNAGRLFERYVEVSLRKRGVDEWVASGNIIPA
jgi:hypothetical protein